jgi:hypothetical protein
MLSKGEQRHLTQGVIQLAMEESLTPMQIQADQCPDICFVGLRSLLSYRSANIPMRDSGIPMSRLPTFLSAVRYSVESFRPDAFAEREQNGWHGRGRICIVLINSQADYQLSYMPSR